jgi:hypothetical protein
MKRPAGVFLVAALMVSFAFAAPVSQRSQLHPNEFTWHAETLPHVPVLMVISLPEQQAMYIAMARRLVVHGLKCRATTTSQPIVPRTDAASPVE